MTNPAIEVQKFGQSLWLDYIHRAELADGRFQRRIEDEGILGVTSNPSIFQKAIGESDTYDQAMSSLPGFEAEDVYEKLAVEDIRAAADIFRAVYDRTNGVDGYVSLEVSPLLANDTATTLAEARRLFNLVDRPNLMVKIPGTTAGIPAIEDAIAAGININVTLLFSVRNYEDVAEAYIRGLERRAAAGEPIDRIASVASFFLSRIDTSIDRILENNIRAAQVHGDTARIAANRRLLGQAAIANAKLAYQSFERIFYGSRFAALREKGARVQRPLWASTGTKNAAYSDTRYLDALIGKDTVNTVPPATLSAFIDHGKVGDTLTQPFEDYMVAAEVMEKLAELGIEMDQITDRLQADGVEAFVESFQTLMDQIRAKLTVLRGGILDRQKIALGIYAEPVNRAIAEIDKKFVNGRVWSKDGSLWSGHNSTIVKIQNRLGWLDVRQTIELERLKKLQASVKGSKISHVALLGMGGSSLAPEVLFKTFGKQDGYPALVVLDSTDPVRVKQVEDTIEIANTLFVVSSKSGGTTETNAFYQYFWEKTGQNAAQFIAITDPETSLAKLATERGFRDCFLNPENIGGRYSALSYFGMVPAALMGLDLERLWTSAREMIAACDENIQAHYHPGITLGAFIGVLSQQGRDKVTLYASESLQAFGDWAEQLVAESLGKDGKGVVPVVGGKVGSPADYVSDRLFIYMRNDEDSNLEEMSVAIRALREAGHPRATLQIPDKYGIAGEFFRWEYATAVAAYVMKLNPFDEPNVSEAKEATRQTLEYYLENGKLPEQAPIIRGEHMQLFASEATIAPLRELCRSHGYDPQSRTEFLAAQIAGTHAGDYFALLCYFTPDERANDVLLEIRTRMRRVSKRAVTIGFGPRYLHSTGQLHKGGANNGVFIQITAGSDEDLPIPGEAYSFGTLFAAQAAGDLEVLEKHNRRVIRVHIEGSIHEGLKKLLDAIRFVEDRRF
jgi:transaldolase / glucose-6-phosphate isomerase